jgi:hypothetical protein
MEMGSFLGGHRTEGCDFPLFGRFFGFSKWVRLVIFVFEIYHGGAETRRKRLQRYAAF